MATIKDVARLAGVSSGTVSNVLNRPSYVGVETRTKVLEAIKTLDFRPAQQARQFRPGRVRTLGLSVANLDNPFFVDVALGAEEYANKLGAGVIILNSAYDAEREEQNLDLLIQQRVQGIVISPIDENSSGLLMLKDRGVPMVFVDRVGDDPDCWSVVVDDFKGGKLSAQHAIERGYKKIAYLGHPEKSVKVTTRLNGVKAAIAESGLNDIELEVIHAESWTVEAGQKTGKLLADRASEKRPRIVICANDMLALGLLQVLVHNGIKVPEEIAIIGYDDLEWAKISVIGLTTIRQPRFELGRRAFEMIMELVDNPNRQAEARHIVLEPELIVRQTS